MTIAIEFDGVIVEDKYPSIGEERAFAFDTLHRLKKKGHNLILWTRRFGTRLDEAVAFCEEHGMTFYAVNKSYPEEKFDDTCSRKVNADLYIDKRMVDDLPDWGAIYSMIKHKRHTEPYNPDFGNYKKRSFFSNLFNR